MIATILSYSSSGSIATIQLATGETTTAMVKVDFSNYVGQVAQFADGILTITPQPPVTIVSADPAIVIDGTLIYNTTSGQLKVGNTVWVAI